MTKNSSNAAINERSCFFFRLFFWKNLLFLPLISFDKIIDPPLFERKIDLQ